MSGSKGSKGVKLKVKLKASGKSLQDVAQKVQGSPIQLPALNLQRFAQGPSKGGKNV